MVILLSAQQLSKSFSGKSLFENISFGIAEGDRVGLLGPNGAGKSTLLKIIAGKMSADSGEVVRKRGMKLGYLEQSPSFEPGQTLLEALGSKLEHPEENVGVVYEWLSKLDLLPFGESFQACRLSGGWQKRLALGRELVTAPDLLLLDEPTNHLDIPGILWLEEFLASQTNMTRNLTLLTVTHDRLFLQRTCQRIFDLDFRNPKGLLVIEGEYLKYVEAKENLVMQQRATEDKWRNTLRRETEWLRRGAQARQTKQKARIENANDLGQNLKDLSKKNATNQIQMDFGNPLKQPKKLIELSKVCFSYGVEANEEGTAEGAPAHSTSMFQDLNILITPKTRLGLIGSNGAGKTTFIKLLLGQLSPTSGQVFFAENLEVSYFEQTKESINPQLSVLNNICPQGDYVHFQGQFVFARSYLDRFRFARDKMDLPASQLSGGEIARLRIAQMMLTKAGVLILDEPTNDLDLETLGVLEQALADFQGGIVLISHDRYFMDQVANEILAIESSQEGPRSLTAFADYLQWEEWFELKESESRLTEKVAEKVTEKLPAKPTDNISAESSGKPKPKVKISFKDRQDWQTIESEISDIENQIKNFEDQLLSPEVATNGAKLTEFCQQIEKSKHLLEAKYQRWEFLAELMQQEKGT